MAKQKPRRRWFKKYTSEQKYAYHKAKVAKARAKGKDAIYSRNFIEGYEDEHDNLKPAMLELRERKTEKRSRDYMAIHYGYVNGLKNNPRFQRLSVKERLNRGALWYREYGGGY